jgi:hypothetical protein
MTTDKRIDCSLNTWLALWDVVVKAEHYLLDGTNTRRNQLDLAVQKANQEAARERQTEQG